MVEKYIEKREIKFRAWDTEGKLMRTIFLINSKGVPLDVGFGKPEPKLKNEFVLMQYTGLKDKNGNEIYEGDILSYCNKEAILLMKWGENDAGFVYEILAEKNENVIAYDIRLYRSEVEFEVIGNVFETPELLESKPTGLPSSEYKAAYDAAFHPH